VNSLLAQTTSTILDLVLEYARLAPQSSLTDAEADRLGEILEKANEYPALNFWIAELDHLISHRLNLLSEDDRESYKDQQAMMREYAIQNDIVMCPNLDTKALQEKVAELYASTPLRLLTKGL
jgi:hypothetical protein